MALKGISLAEIREYVSKSDPDSENPTVFELGVIDAETRAWIEDEGTVFDVGLAVGEQKPAIKLFENKRAFLYLRFGLRGWRNFADAEGRAIPFTTEQARGRTVASVDSITALPIAIRGELAGVIRADNTLQPDEAGN